MLSPEKGWSPLVLLCVTICLLADGARERETAHTITHASAPWAAMEAERQGGEREDERERLGTTTIDRAGTITRDAREHDAGCNLRTFHAKRRTKTPDPKPPLTDTETAHAQGTVG